jgi:ADP-heptose:LPS heptosyltransferase
MKVIHCFEPSLQRPDRLSLPGLAAMRSADADAVAVVPIADEQRRNFDPSTLTMLLGEVSRRHPGKAIRIFVNPVNVGAEAILNMKLPEGTELRSFSSLLDIVKEYRHISAWYGTDTGLFHLAVAMGLPAVVFFGPTQPWKIVMPAQPEATWVRLRILGDSHCEEKKCTRPLCLRQAVATFCNTSPSDALADTPFSCPLREHPIELIPPIRVHENTHRQA